MLVRSPPDDRPARSVRPPRPGGATARSVTAYQTVAVLDALVVARVAPTHIRCDNGPEMTA